MSVLASRYVVAFLLLALVLTFVPAAYPADAPLPRGVRAVWDLEKAYRIATPTHEWLCINGLWRWQPAEGNPTAIPGDNWGFFKVPGSWPGITNYMQKDTQTVFSNPVWRDVKIQDVSLAWYQRQVTIPREWSGRRVVLYTEYLNSRADVFVDGKNVGTLLFPSGELDITGAVRPGAKHTLTLLVTASPLKAVMQAYNDTNSAREVRGSVARRGLCGDTWLISSPKDARVSDLKMDPSVRNWNITFNTALEGLQAGKQYLLQAKVTDGDKPVTEFTSDPFTSNNLVDGRYSFSRNWKPEKLWDIHTPKNMYTVQISLMDAQKKTLDVFRPEQLGFREFWITGRDFYLNGSRLYLSSVPLDNAQVSAAAANYEGACESMRRLQAIGINYVYTHNYGCEPGTHLSFSEVLRAADDVGMLIGLSQPHAGQYDWNSPDAEKTNNYVRHAEFYVRVAQNHPSVVFYPTSHNSTGYSDDMDPDMIDGVTRPTEGWGANNAKKALRAEAIIRKLDPTRVVYHHSSGNLSSMWTSNFYTNWAPIQELDAWFEHWATVGQKPIFTCEYMIPCSWDWSMYRGWYKGKRTYGGAVVPWEFCLAEWNAQFYGDVAYNISEKEKVNLRWEAKKFNAGETWHRWDYPTHLGSRDFEERDPIYAAYTTSNWRAFRSWGMSANSPWDWGIGWNLRPDVDKGRKNLSVDWDNLQKPGLSPDYIEDRYERIDLAYDRSDWISNEGGKALLRNNMPLLAYIAGKSDAFTSKDHNFIPGQAFEKQIIVINNSRETVKATCSWTLGFPQVQTGSKEVTVLTGDQSRVSVKLNVPAGMKVGSYDLKMNVKFSTGEVQTDAFKIDVVAPVKPVAAPAKIALFDPKGETSILLRDLGLQVTAVTAGSNLDAYDVLVVGKGALTPDGAAPDISRVRNGLKVVLFEQTAPVLEKRFGFRIEVYGLRQVFQRVAEHPLLADIRSENLHDWAGSATILPPRLTFEQDRNYGNVVKWCGLPVTRVWRCGNRGNVASVLIEKPACGNFMPIVDGGYSLQYSPLMEYREGRGMVLFCQMDVTGRTESDPTARMLARNVMQYMLDWQPGVIRRAVYVGEEAGKAHLEAAGIALTPYQANKLNEDQVLIVGPGGGRTLAASAGSIGTWLRAGGHVVAIGLDQAEAKSFLPMDVRMTRGEHIAAMFEPSIAISRMAGISPADVHSREPRQIPLVTGGARTLGDGVLASGEDLAVSFTQIAPWQYKVTQQNTKRTFRRTSFLISRLVGNMGVSATTPLLERFHSPVDLAKGEQRWLTGFYLDRPEEWDDPYRFFRW